MKRPLLAPLLLLGTLAAPAPLLAQDHFTMGEVDFGVQTVWQDTDSSKFREYRDIPNGGVLPWARVRGRDGVWFDFTAEDALQLDQHEHLTLDYGMFRLDGDYNEIVHRTGNQARSLLVPTGDGVLEMSDALQRAFQSAIEAQYAANRNGITYPFLRDLVAPSLAAAHVFDLRLVRRRGNLSLRISPEDSPLAVRLTYFQENRSGDRAAGTSFGFGNVVETPEPISYRTTDIGLLAEAALPWGLVRGAVHYNDFVNDVKTLTFDNPFRATDSTDPSAYTAPGAGSIGGASRGRVALPPNNRALTGTLGFLVKLPMQTRVSADVAVSRWKQDEDDFIPYSTNTAIRTPLAATDLSTLPAPHLNGDIDVVSQSYRVVSRPVAGLTFDARFRRYDLSNKTDRIEFPGYVRFDAVWEDIGRISVPYGFTRDRGDATLSYDFGIVSVDAGYRYEGMRRSYRETEKTSEHFGILGLDLRPVPWVTLRGTLEHGHRTYDSYELERSEDASMAEEPAAPGNLPQLRRFDQSARLVDRVSGLLQVTPGGDFMISAQALVERANYEHDAAYGLLYDRAASYTVEGDWTPNARVDLFAFYTREEVANFQRGRQSSTGVISTNPLDDWTSRVDDAADTVGAGATLGLIPDRLTARVTGQWQRVNGYNDLARANPATPASPIANYDDTKIWSLSAELRYQLARAWAVMVGAWIETYRVSDSATTGLPNYAPGGFFLSPSDGDYRGKVAYLRAGYRF